MGKNKEIGKKGESVAIEYLLTAGYSIRETNFKCDKKEIDIICEKDNTLIFVEVKTRRSVNFGYPEEAVSPEKIDNILDCANEYIEEKGWTGSTRYDIISIIIKPGYDEIDFNHIQDAFY